jgi:hypothetical protein
MILNDHERRRRLATTARIDMICQHVPVHAHLRDATNRLVALREACRKSTSSGERDRLCEQTLECLTEMGRLVDLIVL